MSGLGLGGTPALHSKSYLKANIEGGEHYSWFYTDGTNLGRGADPHQAARLGQAAIAAETARLWVEAAAARAEAANAGPDAVAQVGLARLAVERAALDVLELAQRSIGLQAFMRPNPLERVMRDLATYLRQPAPDRVLAGAAAFVLEAPAEPGDLWG